MVSLIPIGRRCNIHQILALDNGKTFKINSIMDGMVTNPVDALKVILQGTIEKELIAIDNRSEIVSESESIKYLHKPWNHKLIAKQEQKKLLMPGSNAAYEENICVWVHQDPRSKTYANKLTQAKKSLKNSNGALLYLTNAPSERNNYQKHREEHIKKINVLLKEFERISGIEVPLLYINLCSIHEKNNEINHVGNGLHICEIKVNSLEWHEEKSKLDLDLSLAENKIAAIGILQAAQKFAKMVEIKN